MIRRLLIVAVLVLFGASEAQAARSTPAQRVVNIARGELSKGVREIPDGSNKGTRIRMYGQSTTPRFYPAPWCAYFVSWAARRAGRPLGPSGSGFGYVPYIKAWAQRTGRWKGKPRSGDLVMFPQHVGLVERVYANGTLTTIEGNSSNRVARRWRRWRDASGYVRFATGGRVERRGSTPVADKPVRRTPKKPVARISVYPSRIVAVGQQVGFSANDSSGDIKRYRWDLDGDGSFDDARGDNAQRRYATAGDVKVGLRVTDRRGRTSVARATVVVRVNQAPVADLDLPRTARIGARVVADAGDSRDPDGDIVRYEWDLDGDGIYVEGPERQETRYDRPGVYTVGLRVVDDQGAVTETVGTVEITQKAPVARASGPRTAPLGSDLAFDGSRSYDPDGDVAAWSWDFDADGNADAEGAHVTWRFTSPGERKVLLTVRDVWGAEARYELPVNITNRAPDAVITAPSSPVSGEDLLFDAVRSTDPDSRIATYEWDFDRDGRWDATAPQARWRFTGSGSRRVRLRVTDEWGARDTAEVGVWLLQRPVAGISLTTSGPQAGSSVSFTGSGSKDPDGTIKRLEWDFTSDGTVDAVTTSTWRSVSTTYPVAGDYAVTLTVVDDDGLRASGQRVVAVG